MNTTHLDITKRPFYQLDTECTRRKFIIVNLEIRNYHSKNLCHVLFLAKHTDY